MTHRWRLNASRNIGLSATLSARALKLAGICFSGFFHHHGMRPQRIETISCAPSAVVLTTLHRVGWRDVVAGLKITSRTVGEFVQSLERRPKCSVERSVR